MADVSSLIGERVVLKRAESDAQIFGTLHSIDTRGYMVETSPGIFQGFYGDLWEIRRASEEYVEDEG